MASGAASSRSASQPATDFSLTGGAFQAPSDLDAPVAMLNDANPTADPPPEESDMLFQGTLRTIAGVPLVYTSFGREQNSLLFLCRIWRLLVIREPPSDSDGETPRRINGVVQSPQHLWDVGCRIYMTAVPDVFRAWRTEAKWRAD